jgi:hypothetical protein
MTITIAPLQEIQTPTTSNMGRLHTGVYTLMESTYHTRPIKNLLKKLGYGLRSG